MTDSLRKRFQAPDSSPSASGTRRATRDARSSTRAPLILDLIFQIQNGEPLWAVSRDLSLGGVFIQTHTEVPFDAELTVTILVPARGRAIRIDGVVRWTSPDGIGVQFGLTGARETNELTELLALDQEKGTFLSASDAEAVRVPREIGAIFETDLLELQRARFRVLSLSPDGSVRVERLAWSAKQ